MTTLALLQGMPEWLASVLTLAALAGVALGCGWLFERFVLKGVRHLIAKTRTDLDDLVVRAIHPAVAILVVVGVLHAGLGALQPRLPTGTFAAWNRIVLALGVLVAAVLVARVTSGLLQHYGGRQERWRPVTRLGTRVGNVLVYVIAFLVVLDSYGISITPIITSLGIAGLAVALALQDTLANVFSGIWIQTQRSVEPGHYVRLEAEALEGFVEEIGWRTTKLRSLPGNIIVIPNQTVAKAIVTDYSLPLPRMGTSLTLATTFDADPERVVPMLLEETLAASKEVSFVLPDPAPSARLNRALPNGWEYWLGFWVPYYYDQWNAQGYILNRIRKRLAAEGIRFAVPITEFVAPPKPGPDAHGPAPGATAVAKGSLGPDGEPVVQPAR